MQFRPNSSAVLDKILEIDCIPENEVFVKRTGLEDINWDLHKHNRHQIIYVLSGTLHLKTETMGYFVAERHFVWIPEGVLHCISSNNARISLLVIYFCHHEENSENLSVFMADEFASRNLDYLAPYGKINRDTAPELYTYAVSFLKLLPKVCRKGIFPAQPIVSGRNNRISPVLDYIKSNLSKDLSLDSVAAATGYSVRNLTRIFTKSGMRFVRFVNYQRIVRAIELLTDNDMSIEEAAYEVGFSSPNTFSRVFKHITGESPSGYLGRRQSV